MAEYEQALPIDIHYNKLLDWLIDRRHCDSKWLAQIRPIRERVQANFPHLPPDVLASFSDQQPLCYFQCLKILDAVRRVDGDTKSLFGKYTSARVQEWAEVVSAYERRSVYLAECAQQLTRNVNYEIPALKQAVLRCQQIQRDCTKRERDARSSAASLRSKFISSCQEMGIEGVHVRDELQQLLTELPAIFQHSVNMLPTLSSAVDFYQSFIQRNTGRPVQQDQFLSMLHYITQHGNVTIHKWKHGTDPPEPSKDDTSTSPGTDVSVDEIDWGDTGGTVIDWDDENVETLDIEVVEESGGHTAAEDLLETLLSSSSTRSLFLDDVMELKEFLSWRVREETREADNVVQLVSSEMEGLHTNVETMLASVTSVLDSLTNSRTQHLLLMKSSVRYLDRLATSIMSPQMLANKATAQAEAMAARREEAVDSALSLQPQLTTLTTATKELQKEVEERISKMYKNREVNIIGEINVM